MMTGDGRGRRLVATSSSSFWFKVSRRLKGEISLMDVGEDDRTKSSKAEDMSDLQRELEVQFRVGRCGGKFRECITSHSAPSDC